MFAAMFAPLVFSFATVEEVCSSSASEEAMGRFAYDLMQLPKELEAMLAKDVVAPNSCNICVTPGENPVWLAPGDLCALQRGGRLTNHAVFKHCTDGQWKDDLLPAHHVKACLAVDDMSFLWEQGYCHDAKTGLPSFSMMKEGLLFCWNPLDLINLPSQLLCIDGFDGNRENCDGSQTGGGGGGNAPWYCSKIAGAEDSICHLYDPRECCFGYACQNAGRTAPFGLGAFTEGWRYCLPRD